MASCVPISDSRLEEIKQETRADESMQVLTKVILQGWPDDNQGAFSLGYAEDLRRGFKNFAAYRRAIDKMSVY